MKKRTLITTATFGCLWPTVLLANAAVPMVFLSFPLMLLALVPIILIEENVLKQDLELAGPEAYRAATTANLVSTLVGIPVSGIALAVISLVIIEADFWEETLPKNAITETIAHIASTPWLVPYEEHWARGNLFAQLVLLIPFFYVSWWIETPVVARVCKQKTAAVRPACFRANLRSYMFLAAILAATLAVIVVADIIKGWAPAVSEQKYDALKAEYGKELALVQRILEEMPSNVETLGPSRDLKFDPGWLAEMKSNVDCTRFSELRLSTWIGSVANEDTPPMTPVLHQICITWNHPGVGKERRTEYGFLTRSKTFDGRTVYVLRSENRRDRQHFRVTAGFYGESLD